MTTQKYDGGPAFPYNYEADKINEAGISVRDYFAGKALETKQWSVRPYDDTGVVAKDCYAMADAMLEARK